MQGLTFKQRLQLYKTAKKPRKQIRLKLEIITNGLNLPKVEKCQTKVKQAFKLVEANRIEPQINQYVAKRNEIRGHEVIKQKENFDLLRYKNRVESLKNTKILFQERLNINSLLDALQHADGRNDIPFDPHLYNQVDSTIDL